MSTWQQFNENVTKYFDNKHEIRALPLNLKNQRNCQVMSALFYLFLKWSLALLVYRVSLKLHLFFSDAVISNDGSFEFYNAGLFLQLL